MTVNLLDDHTDTRPAMRLERWFGHGIDIGVKIDRGTVTFVCRDILEALGADLDWTEKQPDRTRPLTERLQHCTTWSIEQLHNAVSVLGTLKALDLLSWARAKIEELEQPGLDNIQRASQPNPPAITHLGPAPATTPAVAGRVPAWYSVADAAMILSRDPLIEISQKQLFDWMRARGWVTRPTSVYEPSPDLVAVGWLHVRHRRVRALESPYPQIHITPAGLRQIHERLGGTSTIDLTVTRPDLTEE